MKEHAKPEKLIKHKHRPPIDLSNSLAKKILFQYQPAPAENNRETPTINQGQ